MKKNISINLFGTLYAIDEDAYALLEHYLDSMKSYFSRQEGGEEIADDIEHRVAELLWEQKQKGAEAVNIEMVRNLIAKIGNPDEIAGEDVQPEASSDRENRQTSESHDDENVRIDNNPFHWRPFGGYRVGFDGKRVKLGSNNFSRFKENIKERIKNRHLYRDPVNKLLGGVLSGLATYFDTGDPLWWRIGFFALAILLWNFDIMAFGLPLFYLILWAIVPEARTPEDRLRMMGREVTLENINEQIITDSTNASGTPNPVPPSGGSKLLKVLLAVFLIICFLPIGILLLMLFLFIIMVVSVFGHFNQMIVPFDIFPDDYATVPEFIQSNSAAIWFAILFGLLALGIPLYAIGRALFASNSKLSRRTKVCLLVIWIISLIMMCMTFFNTFARFMTHMQNRPKVSVHYGVTIDNDTIVNTDSLNDADTTYYMEPFPEYPDSVK